MNLFRTLLVITTCLFSNLGMAAGESDSIEQQASQFMDEYLAVYNRRLNRPEHSDLFRSELAALVHTPLLLSPPTGTPQVPSSADHLARNFEAFVTQLEGKDVVRLEWQQTQFRVLTPNKVLANNIGHGVTANGDVAYETISLYLLHRPSPDESWKIAMFSPYSLSHKLSLD